MVGPASTRDPRGLISMNESSETTISTSFRTEIPSRANVRKRNGGRYYRTTMLGFAGSLTVMVGGFGSAATMRQDPLMDRLFLSWLRFGHGEMMARAALWIGIGVLIVSWLHVGQAAVAHRVSIRQMWGTAALWSAPLIVAVPMFSRDAYSYLAQGALLRDGFDPYEVGPAINPGPLLDEVSTMWMNTTAPYGPLSLLVAERVTSISGDNVVFGVIALRLAMLPGLAMTMWAVPRIARHFGADPVLAVWMAVLNPLVLVHAVGGVHNDMLMVGLLTVGLACALDRRMTLAVALIALAATVKFTAGLALPFVAWMWIVQGHSRREHPNIGSGAMMRQLIPVGVVMAAVTATVFWAVSSWAGVGLGWLTGLTSTGAVVNWLTLPTATAQVTTVVLNPMISIEPAAALLVARAVGVIILIIALTVIWWSARRSEYAAIRGLLSAMVAVVVLSPFVLPWYYSWPLAIVAALSLSEVSRRWLVGLSVWVMIVFLPDGSTGMYSAAHVSVAVLLAWLASRALVSERDGGRFYPNPSTVAGGSSP
ncbi:alpha-(1-_6)-mannopyranosyltransferase A [Rhodococcus sp. 06-412-2C]|nr:alpha-(1->6)-mannopyranosyltransferase A [Rhodococcus sp. 06-412-2C]OZC94140.1 alpha-(1->6)-mannopyranosyltransferase A [Rhodococcus sp. 06-412-2B]